MRGEFDPIRDTAREAGDPLDLGAIGNRDRDADRVLPAVGVVGLLLRLIAVEAIGAELKPLREIGGPRGRRPGEPGNSNSTTVLDPAPELADREAPERYEVAAGKRRFAVGADHEQAPAREAARRQDVERRPDLALEARRRRSLLDQAGGLSERVRRDGTRLEIGADENDQGLAAAR